MSTNAKSTRVRQAVQLVIGAGAALMVTMAPVASADPILPVPGSGSASDAVQQLQDAGYTVAINYSEGRPNVPLSECRVTAIRSFGGDMTSTSIMMMLMEPDAFNTADVDVVCPNAK